MRTVTCDICSNVFTTNHAQKMRCSDECTKLAFRKHQNKYAAKYRVEHYDRVVKSRDKYYKSIGVKKRDKKESG